eukprot:9977350-Karenia_brevis.AAC.1
MELNARHGYPCRGRPLDLNFKKVVIELGFFPTIKYTVASGDFFRQYLSNGESTVWLPEASGRGWQLLTEAATNLEYVSHELYGYKYCHVFFPGDKEKCLRSGLPKYPVPPEAQERDRQQQ